MEYNDELLTQTKPVFMPISSPKKIDRQIDTKIVHNTLSNCVSELDEVITMDHGINSYTRSTLVKIRNNLRSIND